MLEAAPMQIAQGDLSNHPALLAWRELAPGSAAPPRIEKLKGNKKSAIYRLPGAGPSGTAVIAKRCLTHTALVERTMYQEILPALPLPALRCYGSVPDDSPEFYWLFIEDAGNDLYLPELPTHSAAAARWLAILHTSASRLPLASRLPERGARFYLERLRLARATIIKSLTNPALQPRDFGVLEEISAQCDFLELRWNQVEQLGEGLPRTVVHGDLKAKNIRVRSNCAEIVVLPFDWELAGWGIPATDVLKCANFPLYCSEARRSWGDLTLNQIQKLADLGRIFRVLIAIYWKSLALSYEWVEWPVEKLRLYRSALAEAIQFLGIN
jgi:hypothetical protein